MPPWVVVLLVGVGAFGTGLLLGFSVRMIRVTLLPPASARAGFSLPTEPGRIEPRIVPELVLKERFKRRTGPAVHTQVERRSAETRV